MKRKINQNWNTERCVGAEPTRNTCRSLTIKSLIRSGQNKRLFFCAFAIIFVAMASILIFYGCKKESTLQGTISQKFSANNQKLSNNIRVFDSFEAVHYEIDLLNSMDEQELRDHENAIGFQSFGRMAEDIYYPLVENPCDITVSVAQSYVSQYPAYLEVNEDEEHEYEFVPKYGGNPFYYIMNEDRMFKVGGDVYRVFKWVILGIPVEKAEELFNISEENIVEVVEEILERNPDSESSTQKSYHKFLEWSLFIRGYFGGNTNITTSGGYGGGTKGGGGTGGGGTGGGGTGGGGTGGGNNCGTNYGDVIRRVEVAPNGTERLIGEFIAGIEPSLSTGISRCTFGQIYLKPQWRCCKSCDRCWIDWCWRTLHAELNMRMCDDGNIRSENLTYHSSRAKYHYRNMFIPYKSQPYNGSYFQCYITQLNGEVGMPTVTINLNYN